MAYTMNAPLTMFDLGPDIYGDQRMLVLAREIASDIYEIEDIIKRHGISREQFEIILRNPKFTRLLEDATTAWGDALNTGERIKVKSLSMLEDWLVSAYAMLHADKHSLRDKVELAKLIGRLGGIGEKGIIDTSGGERISISINMGDTTKQLDVTKTIEHEPVAT